MKKAIFAGSFDPPTTGHEKVVEEGLKIFDNIVVALMDNPEKHCLFSAEERLTLLKELFSENDRVKIVSFNGPAVELLKREDTVFYLRGVRDTIDFEYENRNNFASKKLMPEMVTIYVPAEQERLHVSSALVRNSIKFKTEYDDYIPKKILKTVKKYLENKDV